VYHRAIKY